MAAGCGNSSPPRGAAIAIVGESTRVRIGDAWPAETPWFDGKTVTIVAARGEVVGLQVHHAQGEPVSLVVDGGEVTSYEVTRVGVTRPSTRMYGGSHGAGDYADGLVEKAKPTSDPAYFEVRYSVPGHHAGELAVGRQTFHVDARVAAFTLDTKPVVWAYEDPKEFADRNSERQCIVSFARRGVLLGPDIKIDDWPERRPLVAGWPFVPVVIPADPAEAAPIIQRWVAALGETKQVGVTIPVDEPHTPEAGAKVKALADEVDTNGGGPGKLLLAVTDDPRPEYGDAIDLYITLHARRDDTTTRWTYNGAPPRAGSMVVDAETPGVRTWGWIGWRYRIPIWYVWDAAYWHDRYHAKRALDLGDAVSFDDGEDRGNLDGVLALPGCVPTLRLAALYRGSQDRRLLELASRCKPAETDALAARVMPVALGDAGDTPSWSSDEASWELARRTLIELAGCK